MMTQKECHACGNKYPEEAIFCGNCGTKLETTVQSEQDIADKSKTQKNPNIVEYNGLTLCNNYICYDGIGFGVEYSACMFLKDIELIELCYTSNPWLLIIGIPLILLFGIGLILVFLYFAHRKRQIIITSHGGHKIHVNALDKESAVDFVNSVVRNKINDN